MIPSRVTRVRVDTDPMDADAVNSLTSGKGKGSLSPRDGFFSAVEHIFNETAMHARAQASNRTAKAIKASHGPKVSPQSPAEEKVKRTKENPKESPKEPKVRTEVPKVYTRAKHRKLVSHFLKTRNSETSSDIQESAQTCHH